MKALLQKLYFSCTEEMAHMTQKDKNYCQELTLYLQEMDALTSRLDDEGKKIFERLSEHQDNIMDTMELNAFSAGLRMGIRLYSELNQPDDGSST